MSKTKQVMGILLVLGIVLFVACAPKASPAPVPQAPAPAPAALVAPVPTAPVKPAWQEEWEKTLTVGKKEGRVVVLGSSGPELRVALDKVARLGGITGELISGRGAELLAKVGAERRAGLYLNDVYVGGYTSILLQAKPAGMLDPLDSSLILPEVTDPKMWYKDRFPWVDRDHTVFATSLHPQPALVINTNLVKPEEMKSYRDVLNPKWQGKVIVNDPTVAGAGERISASIATLVGWDYLRELAKTKPSVMRDERLQLEWLAHGKVAIVVGPKPELLPGFIDIGAPIKGIVPVEGTWLTAGGSGISWYNKAPHLNASKVFINLLASKEGQDIFTAAAWHHSARLDASIAHLPSWRIRREGEKYLDTSTEEFTLKIADMQKTTKEIFGPLMK